MARAEGVDPAVDLGTVLGKIVAVLFAFQTDDHGVSLAELRRRTGLPKGTLHRVVGDLVDVHLLDRTDHGYRLSVQVFQLGMRATVERGLIEVATPFMEDLYERTHETVNLGVLDGNRIVYVAKIGGHRQVTAPSRIGGRLPLHCTAIGKALLAFAPPELLVRVVEEGRWPPHPAHHHRSRPVAPATRPGGRDRSGVRVRGIGRRSGVRRRARARRPGPAGGGDQRHGSGHGLPAGGVRPVREGGRGRHGSTRTAVGAGLTRPIEHAFRSPDRGAGVGSRPGSSSWPATHRRAPEERDAQDQGGDHRLRQHRHRSDDQGAAALRRPRDGGHGRHRPRVRRAGPRGADAGADDRRRRGRADRDGRLRRDRDRLRRHLGQGAPRQRREAGPVRQDARRPDARRDRPVRRPAGQPRRAPGRARRPT